MVGDLLSSDSREIEFSAREPREEPAERQKVKGSGKEVGVDGYGVSRRAAEAQRAWLE
jgi:hypothetical protein